MKNFRQIKEIITGTKVSDGDGVQLTRIIGTENLDMLDPFLLLDAFGSDIPQDYIGGFPPHPHRGFETVTYMLAGKMRHKDSAGNAGVIESGDVQWMRAGKGIVHSEMPEQEEGLLAGLQLWVNLPASHKMVEPEYQELSKNQIPVELRSDTARIKVIAGKTNNGTQGVVKNDLVNPIYWDIQLDSGSEFTDSLPQDHNAFIYVIEGALSISDQEMLLVKGELAILSFGNEVKIKANADSRFILVAGKPLNEPVARGGPFVMNTREEIEQAFADYKSGALA